MIILHNVIILLELAEVLLRTADKKSSQWSSTAFLGFLNMHRAVVIQVRTPLTCLFRLKWAGCKNSSPRIEKENNETKMSKIGI